MDCIYHVEINILSETTLLRKVARRSLRWRGEKKKKKIINNGIESKLYVKRDLKKLAAWSSIIPGAKFKCVASIPLGYFI